MLKTRPFITFALSILCSCSQDATERDNYSEKPYIPDQDKFTKFVRDNDYDISKELSSYDTSGFTSGRVAFKRGRSHMVPNKKHNQFALYEGESFVLDLGYYPFNYKIHKSFTIRVLADFSPVEFALIKTAEEDDYPSVESLLNSKTNLNTRHDFDLDIDAPNKLTVVVPPSSFTKLKAYDIRILITPDIGPKEDVNRITDPNLSFSMTLYYGGTSFNQVELSSPKKTALIKTSQQLTLLNGFGFSNSALVPSLDYLNDQSQPLASRLQVAQTTTASAIYYADPDGEGASQSNAAVIYNAFIVNKEMEDGKFVRVKKLPFTVPSAGLQAPVEEIDLDLSEDREKTVYFVTFDRPYKDQASVDSEFHPLIRVSNPLFLGHVPQD